MLVGWVVSLFTPHLSSPVRKGTMPGARELCNDMSASMKRRQFNLMVRRANGGPITGLNRVALTVLYQRKNKPEPEGRYPDQILPNQGLTGMTVLPLRIVFCLLPPPPHLIVVMCVDRPRSSHLSGRVDNSSELSSPTASKQNHKHVIHEMCDNATSPSFSLLLPAELL